MALIQPGLQSQPLEVLGGLGLSLEAAFPQALPARAPRSVCRIGEEMELHKSACSSHGRQHQINSLAAEP